MKFIVDVNGKKYDIRELVNSVSYEDRLNDGCSKLEFTYVTGNPDITNGSSVWFNYNNTDIFKGRVFKREENSKQECTITAYDQLRYAKAKDYFYIKNDTLTALVSRMCSHFNFTKGHIANTGYTLKTQVFDGDTWLDDIYSGISETLMNKGKMFCLRDEYGKVTLRDLEDLKLNIMVGDKSLCYDYSHSESIDENFYNQIIILLENEVKGTDGSEKQTVAKFVGIKNDTSIKKYGLMQYYEKMQNSTAAHAQFKANALLRLYNQETETLSLECLGDTRVRAGVSFLIEISELGIKKQLYVSSVTHNFLPVHTMSIEVAV